MSWFKRFKPAQEINTSILYDENTFYQAFIYDLNSCKKEVIIESPYVTSSRMERLLPIFKGLLNRGVEIQINTKDPVEHDEFFIHQATNEILEMFEMGININLLKGNFHRKLAIIDKTVLWEGSLNILSQNNSKEFMRRIESRYMTKELFKFLKFDKLML